MYSIVAVLTSNANSVTCFQCAPPWLVPTSLSALFLDVQRERKTNIAALRTVMLCSMASARGMMWPQVSSAKVPSHADLRVTRVICSSPLPAMIWRTRVRRAAGTCWPMLACYEAVAAVDMMLIFLVVIEVEDYSKGGCWMEREMGEHRSIDGAPFFQKRDEKKDA